MGELGIIDCIKYINYKQNIHDFASLAIENVMKYSVFKRTLDNITVILIAFKNMEK